MDHLGPLLTAVLAANMLTAMFLFGMKHAFSVRKPSDLKWGGFFQMLVPLLVLIGGAAFYW